MAVRKVIGCISIRAGIESNFREYVTKRMLCLSPLSVRRAYLDQAIR